MKQNFDMTKPRYSVQILPVPWPFVMSRPGGVTLGISGWGCAAGTVNLYQS